jgi:hypothetical protein
MTMKMYTIDAPVQNWIKDHKDDIYVDILDQCELKLKEYNGDYRIDVALLKTEAGITKFVIKDLEGIFDSLNRAMTYFVETEKYELAARIRDCITAWKELDK